MLRPSESRCSAVITQSVHPKRAVAFCTHRHRQPPSHRAGYPCPHIGQGECTGRRRIMTQTLFAALLQPYRILRLPSPFRSGGCMQASSPHACSPPHPLQNKDWQSSATADRADSTAPPSIRRCAKERESRLPFVWRKGHLLHLPLHAGLARGDRFDSRKGII